MIGYCSYCGKTFDSQDGGNLCSKCTKAACPACESAHFPADGDTCRSCSLGLIGLIKSVYGAFKKPNPRKPKCAICGEHNCATPMACAAEREQIEAWITTQERNKTLREEMSREFGMEY